MKDAESDIQSGSRDHLNSLSIFFLNTTAFSESRMKLVDISKPPNPSIKPAIDVAPSQRAEYNQPIESSKLIDNSLSYSTVVRRVNAIPSPYFNFRCEGFNPATVDYDKLGVIYDYSGHLYTICETAPHPQTTHTQTSRAGIGRGWLPPEAIGIHVKMEWASLPKTQVGKGAGVAVKTGGNLPAWSDDDVGDVMMREYALSVPAVDGWWNVHSPVMQRLRLLCLVKAQEVEEKANRLKTNEPISTNQFMAILETHFRRIIDAMYGTMRIREEETKKATDEFIKEFMVLGD